MRAVAQRELPSHDNIYYRARLLDAAAAIADRAAAIADRGRGGRSRVDGAQVIDEEAVRAAYQQAHEAHLGRGGGGGGGGGGGSGEDAGQMPDQEDMPVMNGPPRAIVPPEQIRAPKVRVRLPCKVHFVAAVNVCSDIKICCRRISSPKLKVS